MRETSLPDRCAGCEGLRWLVAVERVVLEGRRHTIGIYFPHAACGASGPCDHTVAADRFPLTGRPRRLGSRTTSSRRRV